MERNLSYRKHCMGMEAIQFDKMHKVILPMNVPVFGDIHGNLIGMLNTLQILQQLNGKRYSHVFQVGDFGFFPNRENEQDIKQLRSQKEKGVNDYLTSDNMYERYFVKPSGLKKLSCKIIFIRGNHEDQVTLNSLEKKHPEGLISVDNHCMLYYLPDGRALSITTGPESDIIVAGYGGIMPSHRPKAYRKNPLIAFSEKNLDRLLDTRPIDVLLTHQGTHYALKGDETITSLCELISPQIHIHGHSHHSAGPYNVGRTKSYALGKLPKEHHPNYNQGFLGFLKSNEGLDFTIIQQHEAHPEDLAPHLS